MARAAKAAAPKMTRKRLTPEQKAEIAQAFANGETGNAIAARVGVSVATIYAQKKKLGSSGPTQQGESALRGKLVSFAVRTLLKQSVSTDETTELKREVDAMLVRMVSAGI